MIKFSKLLKKENKPGSSETASLDAEVMESTKKAARREDERDRQILELEARLAETQKEMADKLRMWGEKEGKIIEDERAARKRLEHRLAEQETRIAEYTRLLDEARKQLDESKKQLLSERQALKRQAEAHLSSKPAPPVPVPAAVRIPAPEPEIHTVPSGPSGELYEEGMELVRRTIRQIDDKSSFDYRAVNEYSGRLVRRILEDDQEILRVIARQMPEKNYLINQAVNTAVLAIETGIGLNYGEEQLVDLGAAALLHDLGLVRFQDAIEYPKALNPEKKDEIMKHPIYLAEALRNAGANENVTNAVLQHHERVDGKGYPSGLKGPEISAMAKILQVVDAFEAATHARPYRREKTYPEALKEIFDLANDIYDASAVKALVNRIGLYPIDSLVELSTGQVAKIAAQNRAFPTRPVVVIEFSARGTKNAQPQTMDLRKQPSVHILGVIKDIDSFSKASMEVNKPPKPQVSYIDIAITIFGIAVAFGIVVFLLKL